MAKFHCTTFRGRICKTATGKKTADMDIKNFIKLDERQMCPRCSKVLNVHCGCALDKELQDRNIAFPTSRDISDKLKKTYSAAYRWWVDQDETNIMTFILKNWGTVIKPVKELE